MDHWHVLISFWFNWLLYTVSNILATERLPIPDHTWKRFLLVWATELKGSHDGPRGVLTQAGEEHLTEYTYSDSLQLNTKAIPNATNKVYLSINKPIAQRYTYTLSNELTLCCYSGPSRWPRGLRLGSAAPHLLGMCVRIPPGAWMLVSCEWWVLSRRGLYDRPIPRPEEPYRVCVCVCMIRCNSNLLHLQWVGSRGQTTKE